MFNPPVAVPETKQQGEAEYWLITKTLFVRLLAYGSMVLVVLTAFQCGHWSGESDAMVKAGTHTVNLLYDHAMFGTLAQPSNRELAPGALMELQTRDKDLGKVRSYRIVSATGGSGGSAYFRVKTNRDGVDYIEVVYWTRPETRLNLGMIKRADEAPDAAPL